MSSKARVKAAERRWDRYAAHCFRAGGLGAERGISSRFIAPPTVVHTDGRPGWGESGIFDTGEPRDRGWARAIERRWRHCPRRSWRPQTQRHCRRSPVAARPVVPQHEHTARPVGWAVRVRWWLVALAGSL